MGRINIDTEIFLGKWFGSWNIPFCCLLFSLKSKSKYYTNGKWRDSEIRDYAGSGETEVATMEDVRKMTGDVQVISVEC